MTPDRPATSETVAKLRKLLAEAWSALPWQAADVSEWITANPTWEVQFVAPADEPLVGGETVAVANYVERADAQLIAAAVNALPGLLDALDRANALADEFESEIDWSDGRSSYGDNEAWASAARRLRAALDPSAEQGGDDTWVCPDCGKRAREGQTWADHWHLAGGVRS